jgi:hypothetical protein
MGVVWLLNPVGRATSRTKAPRGSAPMVRGNKKSAPRTMIGVPTKYSSGRPKALGGLPDRRIADKKAKLIKFIINLLKINGKMSDKVCH